MLDQARQNTAAIMFTKIVAAVDGQVEVPMDSGIGRGVIWSKLTHCREHVRSLVGRVYAYGLAAAQQARVPRAARYCAASLKERFA